MKNPFRRLYMYYVHDMGMQAKLLISHLVLILIPTVVLSIFFYNNIYNLIVNSTIKSSQTLCAQTAYTLEATVGQVSNAVSSVLSNPFAGTLFNVPEAQAGNYKLSDEDIEHFVSSVTALKDQDNISAVRIYCDDAPYYRLAQSHNPEDEKLFAPISAISSTYWYGIYSTDTKLKDLLCPPLYLSPAETRESGELAYISKITYANSNKASAYVAVYFRQKDIDNILQEDMTVPNSATYIINERDALVSTSNATLAAAYFMNRKELTEKIGATNHFIIHPFINEEIYIGYYTIANTDWDMVSVLSVNSLKGMGNTLVVQFVMIYGFFLILALAIALLLSRSITHRISNVAAQMEKIRHGKPHRMEQETPEHDEIGKLIDTYNYMTDQMNELLLTQEKNAKELQLSEFKALQAQINPHFLYNTLDMINWLAQSGQKEELSKAIQALSRFYKLTLSRKEAVGSIEKELEHVSLYVQLQNMRYDNAIDFLIDVPPQLEEYSIPKLTFQPIVENAIHHGIFMTEEKTGSVIITGWREKDDIVFQIYDNGAGMDDETIKQILNGKKRATSGSNIGVYNTHLRLRLLYGPGYGLSYESAPGGGTTATIRLPATLQED